MKIQKVTYVVFVTATLLSATLLSTALYLTDPLVLKYKAAVGQVCASHQHLETEADALTACPQLSLIKDKIEDLQEIRCEVLRLEKSIASGDEAQRGQEIQARKKSAKHLEQDINRLLMEIEQQHQLAQRL